MTTPHGHRLTAAPPEETAIPIGIARDHVADVNPTVRPTVPDPSRRPAGVRSALNTVSEKLDAVARSVADAHGERWPILTDTYDRRVLRKRMERSLGYRPNLRRPTTYNEKLAWRILNDDNPLIALTTDKIAVRDYVAAKVGADLLIPLIGTYERAVDIRWAELPKSFVLKAAHGCAMNLIVTDKDAIDRSEVLRTAERWLQTNYYVQSRERAYRHIPPRLLIEELLTDDNGGVPADYKFLVFHGRTALIRVHSGRFGDHRVNFFHTDLRPADVAQVLPVAADLELPAAVRDMVPIADALAADFDYARIDLYLARGRAWFGEITHNDGNAHVSYRPPEFDTTLGSLWQLPPRTSRGRLPLRRPRPPR